MKKINVIDDAAYSTINGIDINVAAVVPNDVIFFLRAFSPLDIGPILQLGCYDMEGDLITAHL